MLAKIGDLEVKSKTRLEVSYVFSRHACMSYDYVLKGSYLY